MAGKHLNSCLDSGSQKKLPLAPIMTQKRNDLSNYEADKYKNIKLIILFSIIVVILFFAAVGTIYCTSGGPDPFGRLCNSNLTYAEDDSMMLHKNKIG